MARPASVDSRVREGKSPWLPGKNYHAGGAGPVVRSLVNRGFVPWTLTNFDIVAMVSTFINVMPVRRRTADVPGAARHQRFRPRRCGRVLLQALFGGARETEAGLRQLCR